MNEQPTLEERVAKLEALLEKILSIARKHPMGKMIVNLLEE